MLTQDERNALAGRILESSVFFGKYDLSKDQISTYISVLEKRYNKNLAQYLESFDEYEKDAKNKFFPNPANLNQYLEKKLSPDATANEVASRIRSAISKFGWPNPEDAKKYIGDLGWKVVERAGGWSYLCENLGVDLPVLTFHAQARDLTKSMIENNNLGNFDEPIYLDQYKEKKQLDGLISNLIKTIEG